MSPITMRKFFEFCTMYFPSTGIANFVLAWARGAIKGRLLLSGGGRIDWQGDISCNSPVCPHIWTVLHVARNSPSQILALLEGCDGQRLEAHTGMGRIGKQDGIDTEHITHSNNNLNFKDYHVISML